MLKIVIKLLSACLFFLPTCSDRIPCWNLSKSTRQFTSSQHGFSVSKSGKNIISCFSANPSFTFVSNIVINHSLVNLKNPEDEHFHINFNFLELILRGNPIKLNQHFIIYCGIISEQNLFNWIPFCCKDTKPYHLTILLGFCFL